MSDNPSTAVAVRKNESLSLVNADSFAHIQRVAKMLSDSELVPEKFRGNVPNCVIALEMANRMQASWLAIMQNLYTVHGKPGWSSTFVIAMIDTSGRFEPLRFDLKQLGDKTVNSVKVSDMRCVAWTVRAGTRLPANGTTLEKAKEAGIEVLESPPVTIEMAVKEGWYTKNGSKWPTMPELMLRYRAATFFGRLYAADLLMGMKTNDEIVDGGEIIDVTDGEPEIKIQAEPVRAKRAKAKVVETEAAPENVVEMPKETAPAAEPEQAPAPVAAEPEPVTAPAPEPTPAPAEAPKSVDATPSLAKELEKLFTAEGITFENLKATMTRLNVKWIGDHQSYAAMPEKHLRFIYNGRTGLIAECKRDKAPKA